MSTTGSAGGPAMRQGAMVIALVLFVAFAATGIASHEMWRDEHHAWLLARDASSPIQLFENLRWDMTPGFWHLLLWLVTRTTHDPRWMQLLNLAFAVATAWVVLRHAPFPPLQRVLIVFGYYLAYEYAAISRVYALGALFIFAICALWERRAERPVVLGALLTLLANTPSFYGVVAGGFFLLLLAADVVRGTLARRPALLALLIGGAGTLAALAQTLPRGDNPFAAGKATFAFEYSRVARAAALLASSFVPIPDAGRADWWNSNVITGRWLALDALIGLAGLLFGCWLLRRRPMLAASWGAATCGVLFAAYQGGFTGMRHASYVVVLLLAALWIAGRSGDESAASGSGARALALVLAVGVLGGLTAWLCELSTRFSAAEQTARWMRDNGLDRVPVAGADDFVVASLASILDLDRIYYPQRGEWGTFVSWDPKRKLGTTLGEATADVASKVASSGAPMLFVLTRPPTRPGPEGDVVIREATIAPGVRARLLAAFTDSVVPDERMFVYEIAPAGRPLR